MTLVITIDEAKDFVERMEVQDENDNWSFAFEKCSDEDYRKYKACVKLLKKEGLYK